MLSLIKVIFNLHKKLDMIYSYTKLRNRKRLERKYLLKLKKSSQLIT